MYYDTLGALPRARLRPPCKPYVNPQTTHYPTRHSGRHNVLYCDGHVPMLQAELSDALFYVN